MPRPRTRRSRRWRAACARAPKPWQPANAQDIERATAAGLSAPMVDRLKLTPKIIETVALGCEQLAAMPDVIGEIIGMKQQPSGIRVGQMRVPIGVFGMIYESRPNVTIEAASLAIKSGNAAILRGGSEAIESNKALARWCSEALAEAGLPVEAVQLVQTTDREAVGQLIAMPEFVDVIIPRGGKGLIERISREAKVPVIKHLDGNCHVYVDDTAELDMAVRDRRQRQDAEVQPLQRGRRPAGGARRGRELPAARSARSSRPRASRCAATRPPRASCGRGRAAERSSATPSSRTGPRNTWRAVISIKVVEGVDEAIAHINRYSSHHTDAIVTRDHMHAQRFLREVDSASVMVNASTRFADGFEFGLGAEIGISTDKFHARGPVGIEGLTSLKCVVLGQGEVSRAEACRRSGSALVIRAPAALKSYNSTPPSSQNTHNKAAAWFPISSPP